MQCAIYGPSSANEPELLDFVREHHLYYSNRESEVQCSLMLTECIQNIFVVGRVEVMHSGSHENANRSEEEEVDQLNISFDILRMLEANRSEDPEAYERAVGRLRELILRFLIKDGLQRADAEDAAQECVSQLSKMLSSFEGRRAKPDGPPAKFLTYVIQIAINISRRLNDRTQRDTVQGPGRSAESAGDGIGNSDGERSPHAYAISARFQELVSRFMRTTQAHLVCLVEALAELKIEDPIACQIIEQTFFEDKAMHEVAASLGISMSSGYRRRDAAFTRLKVLILQRSMR